MKTIKLIFLLLSSVVLFLQTSCNSSTTEIPPADDNIKLAWCDNPYKTEKFTRIGYTLKLWEFKKEGLTLEQVQIIDDATKEKLLIIEKKDLPYIHQDPIPESPYFVSDKINKYYMSFQLPIPLEKAIPAVISHILVFKDTINNKEVIKEGGGFAPITTITPIIVRSPVKGDNWVFLNQSTMEYHFYTMFFVNGIWTGERYAFDNIKLDDNLSEYYKGDPTKNESYFNYGDTLFAIADGMVVEIKDGLPENDGNLHNVSFNNLKELGGNYIIMKFQDQYFAFYAHCKKNSIMVKSGDVVKEGDPIALLGNSGNSDAPHLHFQIGDHPDFFYCQGLPFMLKNYKIIGELGGSKLTQPVNMNNAFMEHTTVIGF